MSKADKATKAVATEQGTQNEMMAELVDFIMSACCTKWEACCFITEVAETLSAQQTRRAEAL